MKIISQLNNDIKQYLIVTANYWAFTLTDGALRMLVVLYFHALGYAPLQIAMLFIFYEVFGVVTNLIGGWLGARIGLNKTMNIGLFLQVFALSLLLVPTNYLSMPLVMIAQAFSGVAKDLNKMSAKSSIKLLVPKDMPGKLYSYVALLTGSKNALKGLGFFLGGLLLTLFDFKGAILCMIVGLAAVLVVSLLILEKDLGKAKAKPKFKDIFSKSRTINILSAARLFLFASRDVWFVVALPVYLASEFGWSHWHVGGFIATWIIGYGIIQAISPKITSPKTGKLPDGKTALFWSLLLLFVPTALATSFLLSIDSSLVLIAGLLIYAGLFAVNSSMHSYLIVHYASEDGVSLDVGFYYMSNAMGRLIGTVLSGWIFQQYGLAACLWVSAIMVALTSLISLWLPKDTAT
jgi:predicted MFS family arabinose efflux permease